jgi:hypothetical protein
MGSELVDAVRASASRLGVSPSDLLTAMSYETGGKLDPNQWGGKGGKYLGLIQFGPEEQAKYGVKPGMSVTDQVNAAENFLRDRGLKPGMGMLDLYSTINAGRPGLYDRSDAANGGMPGTVADKVATQMVGHRARANTMLGDESSPIPISPPAGGSSSAPDASGLSPGASPAAVAGGETGSSDSATPDYGAIGKAIAGATSQRQQAPSVPISVPQPAGLPAAQKLAAIMQRLQVQNG